jgi:hypothetical protein
MIRSRLKLVGVGRAALHAGLLDLRDGGTLGHQHPTGHAGSRAAAGGAGVDPECDQVGVDAAVGDVGAAHC